MPSLTQAKKLKDPLKYRAQQLRGYWLARSKKIAVKAGVDPQYVPTRHEIEDWLKDKFKGGSVVTPFKKATVKPLDTWQIDHMESIENGGSFDLSNCAILTKQENQEKGSLNSEQYSDLIKLVSSWPAKVGNKFLGRLRMGNYRFTSR